MAEAVEGADTHGLERTLRAGIETLLSCFKTEESEQSVDPDVGAISEETGDTSELETGFRDGIIDTLIGCFKTQVTEAADGEEIPDPTAAAEVQTGLRQCVECILKHFKSRPDSEEVQEESDNEVDTGTDTTLTNPCEVDDHLTPKPADIWGRLNLLAATFLLGCVSGLGVYRSTVLLYMFGEEVPENITLTEGTLFAVFGVVSGTLTILIGYRWVSLIGGALMGVGFLTASFFQPTNIHAFAFFYSVLPGIGRNMVVIPATIVVLEYAKRYGQQSLLWSQSGVIVISSGMVLIHTHLSKKYWETQWKNYLYLQFAVAVAMTLASIALRPLDAPDVAEVTSGDDASNTGTTDSTGEASKEDGSNGVMAVSPDVEAQTEGTGVCSGERDAQEGTIAARILGYSSLTIYRSPFLYTFGLMWFFWDGGQAVIDFSLDTVETYADIGKTVPMVRLAGLLGPVAMFLLLKLRGLNLLNLSLVVVISCIGIGLPSFLASQFQNRIFTIFYAALVGFLKGAVDTALLYTTQLVVGEDHLAIGTGVLVLGQGLGIVTMTTAAAEMFKSLGRVDEGMYLAASLLLVCAGVTLLTYFLVRRTGPLPTHSVTWSKDGIQIQDPTCSKTV